MIIHQVKLLRIYIIFSFDLFICVVCWSPKDKQLVVVTYDGALELYDQNMTSKKKYSPITGNQPYPPCVSVLWISTHQFLLGFSENSPDENTNDSFFHVLVSYEKVRRYS